MALMTWLEPEAALKQRSLVLEQLRHPEKVDVFRYFFKAMRHVQLKEGTFLDVGCGVGHYGLIIEKLYPHLRYYGTDISPAMIEQAKELNPLGTFRVCPFEKNRFGDFDVVLISQVMEMTESPWAALETALLKCCRYVILHRLRLVKTYDRQFLETSYCGETRGFEWNYKKFHRRIGAIEHEIEWLEQPPQQYTIVLNLSC